MPTPNPSPSEESSADQGPFLIDTSTNPVRYPIDAATILSNVKGDVPADQYTSTWTYRYIIDSNGKVQLRPSYSINPNVKPPESDPDSNIGTYTCLESGSGYTCGVFEYGYSMNSDGKYELYNQDYERGGGEKVKGSKTRLGSFVYTQTTTEPQLQPAMCELTSGDATLDGDNYVITVNHSGDCSSPDTWLGDIAAIVSIPEFAPGIYSTQGVTEVSHSDTETVLSVAKADADKALEWVGPEGSAIVGFQVSSGTFESGYEASTISIDLTN